MCPCGPGACTSGSGRSVLPTPVFAVYLYTIGGLDKYTVVDQYIAQSGCIFFTEPESLKPYYLEPLPLFAVVISVPPTATTRVGSPKSTETNTLHHWLQVPTQSTVLRGPE